MTAGRSGRRQVPPQDVARYWQARASGMSITEAAKIAGVHYNTAQKWDAKKKAAKAETKAATKKAIAEEKKVIADKEERYAKIEAELAEIKKHFNGKKDMDANPAHVERIEKIKKTKEEKRAIADAKKVVGKKVPFKVEKKPVTLTFSD
jgi:transposase